jgi:hypothetical protein
MRQFAQPFAQQSVDVGGAEAVADSLQRRRVTGGEPVIQGREGDAFLPALLLGVFVAGITTS